MRRRAVVVGINKYDDSSINALQHAEGDALRVHQFLQELQGALRFDAPKLLQAPTDDEVYRVVKQETESLGPNDLFLFYFAGHGVQQRVGSQHLLLCRNADGAALEIDHTNGAVAYDLLLHKTVGAFSRVFIFDACRRPYSRNARGDVPNYRMHGVDNIRGLCQSDAFGPRRGALVTLLSCSDGEISEEQERYQGGLFTQVLLAEWRAALSESRSAILDNSLLERLRERMLQLSDVTPLSLQQPALVCAGTTLDLFALPDTFQGPTAPDFWHDVPPVQTAAPQRRTAAVKAAALPRTPAWDGHISYLDADAPAPETRGRVPAGARLLFVVAALLLGAAALEAFGVPLLRLAFPYWGLDAP